MKGLELLFVGGVVIKNILTLMAIKKNDYFAKYKNRVLSIIF